jgi:hypothetical protein
MLRVVVERVSAARPTYSVRLPFIQSPACAFNAIQFQREDTHACIKMSRANTNRVGVGAGHIGCKCLILAFGVRTTW